MAVRREELAQRGKRAEAAVKTYLTRVKDAHASFDFQRQYDARSAGGRFQSQVGDYLMWRRSGDAMYPGVLEVKQVDHDFRLPAKNFSLEQIAKLRRRAMTGTRVVVAVFHTTIEQWRFPAFELFTESLSVPSWDLSQERCYSELAVGLADQHPEIFYF